MVLTLKAARVNQDMTQRQAAHKIGVSKYTLSNWERGISYPSARHIKRIESVYGVRYDDLIFLQRNNA